jgi:GGDEF domain-containing protein
MANLDSKSKDLVSTKIDRINHALQENPDGLAPISLNVGVSFSDRNNEDGNVFHDADTALERMKEIRTAGYVLY